jgi:predicted nucleic acid-binding protein
VTRPLVVDANVVAKWLIPEDGSPEALELRENRTFAAPSLLFAEVSNILWKKVCRNQVSMDEAMDALAVLGHLDIDIHSDRDLYEDACRLAIEIDHPAYDCFYLIAAARLDTVLVTADEKLVRKLVAAHSLEWSAMVVSLKHMLNR